jgi:hypothetical protein
MAIDLVKVPSRVRLLRKAPLPPGIPFLLHIAAGDADAIRSAAQTTSRTPEFLREAASFFIEQVLLAPTSDSFRVLGCTPQSSHADLRRNMALLLRWLHPDIARDNQRAVFASRVTAAWENLKTPDRRASYGRDQAVDSQSKLRSRRHRKSAHFLLPAAASAKPSVLRLFSRIIGRTR